MEELWKDTQYQNYQVSNLGRVRSVSTGRFGHTIKEPLVHKPFSTGKGYQRAMLCLEGKQKNVSLAKLVAQAFLGDAPEGCPFVTYRDGNKANCAADNLFYASKEEVTHLNQERKYALYGVDSTLGRELARKAVRDAKYARAMEAKRLVDEEHLTYKEASERVGLSESGVYRIVRGKNNKTLEKANAAQKE